jgi:hypothetical protein
LIILAAVLSQLLTPCALADGSSGKGPDYGKGSLTLLSLVRDGSYDEAYAYFSDETAKMLKAKQLGEVWKALAKDGGSFQSFGVPTVSVMEGFHVVEVPALFEAVEYTLRVAWDAEGAVAGFTIAGEKGRPSGVPATQRTPAPAPSTGPARPDGFLGHWEGNTETPGGPLPIRIDLARQDTTWTGTWDSPAQMVTGLPMTDIRISGNEFQFAGKDIPGNPVWKGKLEGGRITGTLSQSGMQMPFVFSRETLAPPVRPQEPKPPFPYQAEEVSYPVGDIKLAGTLTIPEGKGPFPAALLITGSGPEDRNEEVFGHKPFLILADDLTRAGIAVLRVDDRGVGGSGGGKTHPTSADLAQDILQGVAYLRGRPEVDSRKIGLIGHSEGGLIGPIAASQSTEVAFVVLLAGPGVPGDEIISRQTELIFRANGMMEDSLRMLLDQQHRMHQLIRSGADSSRIREFVMNEALAQVDDSAKAVGLTPEMQAELDQGVNRETTVMNSPWFRYFLTTDPRPFLRRLTVPVLALGGELDLQVDPDQNLPEIKRALEEGGNKDVTVTKLSGLNHLFQKATTGKVEEYARIEETMNPVALQTVRGWIVARWGNK